jgi:hypothetical protein
MTASPESTVNPVVRVPDAGKSLEFHGSLLGQVSTQIRNQPRWLEISLYKVLDGTGRYVLHLCGASVVYHRHNGTCNTGVPTAADHMPLDGEPCRICQPVPVPEDPGSAVLGGLWDLETDRHTTFVCMSAEEVIEKLRKPRNQKHVDGGTLSAPAQRLLDLVAPRDDNFARIRQAVQRI